MRDKKDIRIFFALWPDDDMRDWLLNFNQGLPVERPARPVPAYNLHLTLHFIGNVRFNELDCLQQQARQVSGRPFRLDIDRLGCFRKPRVAWLGCSQVPAAFQRLHQGLGQQLGRCGYRPESRTYQPHITIVRKIQQAPDSKSFVAPSWAVESFVLIESRTVDNGVKYQVIETYPLT